MTRRDVARALSNEFGGQFLEPVVLTGPASVSCKDLPRVAAENFYVRALLRLVRDGEFILVDSAFLSDSTGQRGTHCAAMITAKGQRFHWHVEQYYDLDGTPSRQASVEAGRIHIEVTGIVSPEPHDSTTVRRAEWRTWPEINALGRALQLRRDTIEFEGAFRRYDDGWHLMSGWKRKL